jgi:8-oxo-dGTP pyrophosphatase MutT (NUDIX family)
MSPFRRTVIEPGDDTLEDTAIRETQEELSLDSAEGRAIGRARRHRAAHARAAPSSCGRTSPWVSART